MQRAAPRSQAPRSQLINVKAITSVRGHGEKLEVSRSDSHLFKDVPGGGRCT